MSLRALFLTIVGLLACIGPAVAKGNTALALPADGVPDVHSLGAVVSGSERSLLALIKPWKGKRAWKTMKRLGYKFSGKSGWVKDGGYGGKEGKKSKKTRKQVVRKKKKMLKLMKKQIKREYNIKGKGWYGKFLTILRKLRKGKD